MFCKQLNDTLGKYADAAPVILRVVVGLVFIIHGYGKLFGTMPGMDAWIGMLGSFGVPAPVFFGYLVAGIEFLGGIAVLIGLCTRLAALLLAAVMLVAIVLVHLPNGFYLPNGYEFALVLLGANLALALRGPGKILSLENKLCCKK